MAQIFEINSNGKNTYQLDVNFLGRFNLTGTIEGTRASGIVDSMSLEVKAIGFGPTTALVLSEGTYKYGLDPAQNEPWRAAFWWNGYAAGGIHIVISLPEGETFTGAVAVTDSSAPVDDLIIRQVE